MAEYQIELNVMPVVGGQGHYFWTLRNMQTGQAQQIHGWPLNRSDGNFATGATSFFGDNKLGYLNIPRAPDTNLPSIVYFSGSEEDALSRWSAGVKLAEFIDSKNIDYKAMGSNSNSFNLNVGHAMGFEAEIIYDPMSGEPVLFAQGKSDGFLKKYSDAPKSQYYHERSEGIGFWAVEEGSGERIFVSLEDAEKAKKEFAENRKNDFPGENTNRCFAAGTFIDMADGTQKPIESIEVGDEVLAYDPGTTDGLGTLKPARVARTMTNFVDEIIDFHGVKVTPGHATLCADGPNKGHHIPLMDIIRDDGVVADRDGTLIRAATNLPVGSAGDQMVQVAFLLDKSQQTYFKGEMRLGTLMIGEDGREDWRVMDALSAEGYQVFDDGLIAKDGEAPHPLYWFGAVPKPEDYILKKSKLALEDLYAANGELKSGAPTHAGMTVQ